MLRLSTSVLGLSTTVLNLSCTSMLKGSTGVHTELSTTKQKICTAMLGQVIIILMH